MAQIKGVTSSGFKFAFNKRLLNDYNVVRLLSKINSGKASDDEQIDFPEKVFGEKLITDLIKHVQKNDPDGICDSEAFFKEVEEMLKAAAAKDDDVKNS